MTNLRRMTKGDIALVKKWNTGGCDFLIQWSDFTSPLTEAQLEVRITSPDHHVFIIEDNSVPAGTIQVFRINQAKRTAWIGCFLIDASLRGKGIGSQGLRLAVSYAERMLNINRIYLSVYEFNIPARKCYESSGFKVVSSGRRTNGWNVLIMSKDTAR
jgi:RimJ/RimL family protein N-acetyltransferase